MNDSTFEGSVFWAQSKRIVLDAKTNTGLAASRLRKGLSRFVTQMQIARMQSVLSAMTDEQLVQINLDRRDIRTRAESLVTYKYDGL